MTSSCQSPCVSAGFRAFTVTGCSFIWVTVGTCVAAEMETLLPDVLLRCASAGYCQYVVIALLFVVVNVAVWRCWMSFWLQSLLPLENHKSHSSSTAEVLLEPLGASWDCIHLFDMISLTCRSTDHLDVAGLWRKVLLIVSVFGWSAGGLSFLFQVCCVALCRDCFPPATIIDAWN